MKFQILFVICLILCLITESLDAKKNLNKTKEKKKMKKMKKMMKIKEKMKNKMTNGKSDFPDDLPAVRLQNMIDNAPSKYVIPVVNVTDTLTLNFGIALTNVIEIDSSHMEAVVWLRINWKNEFLKWDPKEYGGIESIRVPIEKIWKPDITLFNSLQKEEMLFDAMGVVTYDGTIMWVPAMKITSSCEKLGKTSNEKCKVNCHLKYGSWTWDGLRIDLTSEGTKIDVNDYKPNKNWDLVGNEQKKNVKYYPCCPEPYVDVTGNLTFISKDDDFTDEC